MMLAVLMMLALLLNLDFERQKLPFFPHFLNKLCKYILMLHFEMKPIISYLKGGWYLYLGTGLDRYLDIFCISYLDIELHKYGVNIPQI